MVTTVTDGANVCLAAGFKSRRAMSVTHAASQLRGMSVQPEMPSASNRGDGQTKPRLLEQVRSEIRARHFSRRTEEAYIGWMRRFIHFHGKRHPAEMTGADVATFLSSLANDHALSAAT